MPSTDYTSTWREIRDTAAAAAVNVAWSQWTKLGSPGRPVSSEVSTRIVDPEALILLSIAFESHEHRLRDLIRWWASVGSGLTSVQRMRALSGRFPPRSATDFGTFSRWAWESGFHPWKTHAVPPPAGSAPERPLKGGELHLVDPASVMVRMRAAFGVGVKADVLCLLLGLQGRAVSLPFIERALGYTQAGLRKAVKEIVLSALVNEVRERPATYSVRHERWTGLLEPYPGGNVNEERLPVWALWTALFPFLISAHELAEGVVTGGDSEHVAASRARDLAEQTLPAWEFHGIEVPRFDRYPGREFASAMLAATRATGAWMEA